MNNSNVMSYKILNVYSLGKVSLKNGFMNTFIYKL